MKKNNEKKAFSWVCECSKKYIPLIILNSVLAAVVSLSGVLLALVSKSILEVATGDAKGSILYYGILLGVIVIAQIGGNALETYCKAYMGSKFNISVRQRIFTAIGSRKFSKISKYHSGDLLNRITGDIDVVQSSVVNIIPNVIAMITKIIGCIAAFILLDPRIALLVLGFGFIVPAFGRILSKYYKTIHKETQRTEGESRSFMQECFENISVMKTFRTKQPITDRLQKLFNYNYKLKMKRSIISIIMHLGMYSLFTIGYYGVLIWGATQIMKPGTAFTFGTLTAFLQLVSQVRAPLQNVSGILPQYYSALASAERLIEIENLEQDNDPVSDETIKEIYEKFEYISVENLSFGYTDELTLKNLSCRIDRGSMTAILGDSGTGKSTLFKLLLSLYEPNSGTITINGEIPIDASVRAVFSYVPQGNMIISGSIRENISICNPDADEDKIIEACKIAEIYDYISKLPDGLDTVLSERGLGLSEGQLQRIAIARAIVADTPVLLLDEATSALDKPTEAKVLRNIKELTGKTVISVTHRTSNLNLCDNIINLTELKENS